MRIGLGLGVQSLINLLNSVLNAAMRIYKNIVIADGGTVESESCLAAASNYLVNTEDSTYTDYATRVDNSIGMVEPSESETFDSTVASILAINTPSLLLIPNGRSNGKMFSALPTDGSGDFVFTGIDANGGRTRVNKAGNVEIVRRNLLPNSTTQSVWAPTTNFTRTNVNIKNNRASNLLVTATQNGVDYQQGLKYTNLGAITLVNGLTYTISFRFKPNDGNGSCAYFIYAPTQIGANFNVFTGVTSSGYTENCTKVGRSITYEGNGIYLVSETFTMTANVTLTTATLTLGFRIGDLVQTAGRNGDFGTPQLELGPVPTSYQESESGVSIPRIDYSSGNASVLLEPQRTNEFWNSIWANSGGVPTNWSFAGTGTAVPNGLDSTYDSSLGVTKYLFTAVAQQPVLFRSFSVVFGNTYVLSVKIKSYSGTLTYADVLFATGAFYSSSTYRMNGSVVSAATTVNQTGILELILVCNSSGSSTIRVGSGALFANKTCTIELSAPQLEIGLNRSTFIITPVGTSATRLTDTITCNVSSFIGATQGTFFVNLKTKAQGQSNSNLNIFLSAASDGLSGDGFWIRNDVTTLMFPKIFRRQGGATAAIYTLTAVENDIAIAWDGVNVVLYVNGVQIGSPILFTTTALNFFNVNPNIIQEIGTIMFFNQRLTNAELAALTTL